MSIFLRQSTIDQKTVIGPFEDTNGDPVTTLTINNTDIRLIKEGGGNVAKEVGGATHTVNGLYEIEFSALDTDSVGELNVSVNMAGARVVSNIYQVVVPVVYDAVYANNALGNALASECPPARLQQLDPGNLPNVTQATLDAVNGLNNLSTAQVKAQMVEVMKTDTSALPGVGEMPATLSIEQMMLYCYQHLRNRKREANGFLEVYDDLGVMLYRAQLTEQAGSAEKGRYLTGV